MATISSPPVLIWQPEGGVSGGPVSNPPVYSQAGTTPLIEGQSYVDVVFGSVQTDDEWVLVECIVVNEFDGEPLNIWPGIITVKTSTGFRLYLNGLPDSSNYFLNWAISGVNIPPPEPFPATTYTLTGPATSVSHVASTAFTVKLPLGGTVASPVTVTPDDGGSAGTFTPASVTLTTGSPLATFTYTPVVYGAITISVTNDGGLTDPADIAFTCVAGGYSLIGPSSGATGVASTDFTMDLPSGGVVIGTVTVTPNDSSDGGTFTPATVGLTTAAPSATFTYTPASTGAKTISVTNNGGLTNPGNLTYTSTTPSLADGDYVSTWPDSSVNGNDATRTGTNRPKFQTNIVNGKPVVRFTVIGASGLNLTTPINAAAPWTVFAVMKQIGGLTQVLHTLACSTANTPLAWVMNSDGNMYMMDKADLKFAGNLYSAAFHVYTGIMSGGGAGAMYVDGTSISFSPSAAASAHDFDNIGWRAFTPEYSNGDIAELIFYSGTLSGTDRANIEKYLGTKYAITVAGGSAVQPDTVSGIKGWWKADSL